jgi:hypothetical protein
MTLVPERLNISIRVCGHKIGENCYHDEFSGGGFSSLDFEKTAERNCVMNMFPELKPRERKYLLKLMEGIYSAKDKFPTNVDLCDWQLTPIALKKVGLEISKTESHGAYDFELLSVKGYKISYLPRMTDLHGLIVIGNDRNKVKEFESSLIHHCEEVSGVDELKSLFEEVKKSYKRTFESGFIVEDGPSKRFIKLKLSENESFELSTSNESPRFEVELQDSSILIPYDSYYKAWVNSVRFWDTLK